MKRIEGEKLSPEVKRELSPKKEMAIEVKKEPAKLPEEQTEIQAKTEELKSFIPELEKSLFQTESDQKALVREKAAEFITEGQGVVARELEKLTISKQEQIESVRTLGGLYSKYAKTYGEEVPGRLLFQTKPSTTIPEHPLGLEVDLKGYSKFYVDYTRFHANENEDNIPELIGVNDELVYIDCHKPVNLAFHLVKDTKQTSEIETQTDSFEEVIARYMAELAQKKESVEAPVNINVQMAEEVVEYKMEEKPVVGGYNKQHITIAQELANSQKYARESRIFRKSIRLPEEQVNYLINKYAQPFLEANPHQLAIIKQESEQEMLSLSSKHFFTTKEQNQCKEMFAHTKIIQCALAHMKKDKNEGLGTMTYLGLAEEHANYILNVKIPRGILTINGYGETTVKVNKSL